MALVGSRIRFQVISGQAISQGWSAVLIRFSADSSKPSLGSSKTSSKSSKPSVEGGELLKDIYFDTKKKIEIDLEVLRKGKITLDLDDSNAVSHYASVMKTAREKSGLYSDADGIKNQINDFTEGIQDDRLYFEKLRELRIRRNYLGSAQQILCSSSIAHRFRIHSNSLPVYLFNPTFTISRDFSSNTGVNSLANDYSSILSEDDFHRLADGILHSLQEKLEDYGDDIQIDGFDMDYASGVLTVKLGNLGTYVINKQTPNKQIWLSSPVSGPARFDWDRENRAWIYRRTKANLLTLLESELTSLLNTSITLAS